MRQILTATKVKNSKPAAKPQKLFDGGGLYLQIAPSGSKLWRYSFRIDGKPSTFAVGSYPEMGLQEARAAHIEARKLVKEGVNPARARKKEKAEASTLRNQTFRVVATAWMGKKAQGTRTNSRGRVMEKKGWKPKTTDQVQKLMDGDVFPSIGDVAIADVTKDDLQRVLDTLEERSPSLAYHCRQHLKAICAFSGAVAYPVFGELRVMRPDAIHHKALSGKELPAFLKALDEYNGTVMTKAAVHLLMLTATRTGELQHAKWEHIEWEESQWRIPEENTKRGKLHLVPLSKQALAILSELEAITGQREYLFPNRRDPLRPMSNTSINRVIENIGYKGRVSGHGFRGMASTWGNESGYKPDVIERCLAHAPEDKTRKAYNHAEFWPERVRFMQDWADYLDRARSGKKNVVQLRQGRSLEQASGN